MSTDEDETSDGSDYDSESSYDPSVLTEDEEFIDDSDGSSSVASSDTYEFDESSDSADDSKDATKVSMTTMARTLRTLRFCRLNVFPWRLTATVSLRLMSCSRQRSSSVHHTVPHHCMTSYTGWDTMLQGRSASNALLPSPASTSDVAAGACVDGSQALSNTEAPSAVKH
jgi:hypothetical protein